MSRGFFEDRLQRLNGLGVGEREQLALFGQTLAQPRCEVDCGDDHCWHRHPSVYHAADAPFYNGHVRTRHTPTVVLLDLDDTLFDHGQWRAEALATCTMPRGFAEWPFDAFEARACGVLENCTSSPGRAANGRSRRASSDSGGSLPRPVPSAGAASRDERPWRIARAYQAARRPVSGAGRVARALKPHARIGIVSNNILEEQQEKIAHLRLRELYSTRSPSRKRSAWPSPTRRSSRIALRRLQTAPAKR